MFLISTQSDIMWSKSSPKLMDCASQSILLKIRAYANLVTVDYSISHNVSIQLAFPPICAHSDSTWCACLCAQFSNQQIIHRKLKQLKASLQEHWFQNFEKDQHSLCQENNYIKVQVQHKPYIGYELLVGYTPSLTGCPAKCFKLTNQTQPHQCLHVYTCIYSCSLAIFGQAWEWD